MPVDLRQISFYPQQRQYIFSDSEPGIEIVQSGSGDYIKCTDASNDVVFRITNAGLITSAVGAAEYSTIQSPTGNPMTVNAQGANQDLRLQSNGSTELFLDGATSHIQIGGAHTDTPDSRLHVIGATAGSVTAVTDTIITAENDDNAFISLLAPTSSGILFGDVADADIGRITYTHSNNALNLFVSASQQFTYTDAQLQFNKATNIRTSSGSLTLQPVSGAHLNFTLSGTGDFRVNTSQLYVDTSAARVGVNTATPSAGLEVVVSESATVPALMVQNSFDSASNQVAVFKGSNRGTAADNDSSYISYMMEDDSGSAVEVGRQIWQINDVTASTKDSKFTWQVMVNNTLTDMLEISSSAAAVPTATFASGDAIFNDSVSIRLGTAGAEADLSSNGTDVKWEYAATADLLLGRASSPAPNGLLHLWEATAGSVDSITDSLLTLENDDNAYISILAPTVGGVVFGDAAANNVGSITYTHGTNTLNTTINAASQLNHTDGAFAFAKATTVSTSSGTLTINAFTAGGAIDFASQAMTGVDINSGTIGGVTIDGTATVTADATFNDNVKVTLGTGGDVDVYYDATDMVINTRVAGTGDLVTHSQIVWGTGTAVTSADYSVGRDADGTNQMHLNVPTGAGWEYSINNTAKLTYATGAFNFTEATSITTSAGQLTIDGAGGVVINEDGDDEDFRVEANGNANALVIDANTFGGTGSMAIGNAVVNTAYLRIAPIAITSTANQPYAAVRITPVGVTVPSGTSSVVSSLHVVEPVISATGTVTVAATVYIQDAPTEGTNDYALFVDAGATRLDGTLTASAGGALTGTWSDLGTVTTIDINGGSIDGVTIGTNAVVTDLRVDQLQINDGTISTLASNNPIILVPHGTGDVQLDADQVRIGDANANATLTTNGTGDLILNTNEGTNSGSITIADAANGNISILPNGTGDVVITADTLDVSGEAMNISIVDNSSTSLTIKEGSNSYLIFNTADSGGSKIVPGVKIEAGAVEIEGSAFDINGGTVDAITTLTLAANVDVGDYTIRANNFLADSHTATRLFFAGTDGVLSTDSDLTFATDTLTVTKIGAFEAVGAISFANQNMTLVDIDSGAIDGTVIGANSAVAGTFTAIVGTTIDATTDFTIGSTVITDDVITFTPSSSDTIVLTAATNGAFSLVTTDAAGADATIQITADGTSELAGTTVTLDASLDIVLSADGGNVTMDDGTLTIFDFNVDDTTLTIHDDQDTGDKAVITMAQHGALSIVTTDDDAAAANIIITADGTFEADGTTITLDSSGDVVLDAAGGDVFFKAGGTTFGSATNTSGNLILKSGTTTALTFAGANVTTAGTVTTGSNLLIGGDISTAAAQDWDLVDNNASALSFDAAGKASILEIDTRNGAERVTMSGDLYVAGDVEIAGTNTTFSSTVINIADPLVALATTNTGNAVDIGFFGRYRTNGTNLYTGFVWDADASKYILFHGNQSAPTTTVSVGTGYTASTLVLGTLETTNIAAHNLTGKLTAGSTEIEGSGFDINGGTVDAITSLTIANNVDVGNYKVTAKAFEASDLTAGRITFAGSNGLLADDSDLTFSTDTLTATKIGAFEAAGAINFASQAMTSVNIDSGAIDGVTLGINSAITNAVIDDVAINGKVITMTGSSSDTTTMTAATNGAFSLVTVDDAAAAANIQITADGTVDIDSAGALTLDSGAAINLEPAANSVILLDGTISIDAGVVTGATSITSTAFVGTIDGVVGGNTPAAITGTTIDATTDFTIGSLVITDDSIVMTPSASDTVTLSANTNGAFSIVTVDAAAAAANFQITADGTVDIDSAGVLTLDSGAAINIEPADGSAILLDGTISVDAGVVTGATSITSTNFVGTVTTATQNSITTMTGLVTTSALNSGSITSGFGNIDVGASSIAAGSFDASDGNITNVGNISLDSLSSDAGAGITLNPTTDVYVANTKGMVVGHTAQLSAAGSVIAEFQVLGTATYEASILMANFQGNDNGPLIIGVASNHGSIVNTSGTIVTDNQVALELRGAVDDGTDLESQIARISMQVDGTPGANDSPGRLVFSTTADSANTVTERMRVDALGRVFIGDTTIGTSVDMDTAGLVINQAGGDKHILALKSSDVAHGMTTLAETDTYGFFKKSDTMGGLRIEGFKATGGTHSGLSMRGIIDGTQNTTKSTSGNGTIALDSAIRDGTGRTAVGSNGNLLTVANNGTTRFIFDAEGDFYADASVNADYYDDYNDPVLVRDLDLAITQRFDQWTQYNRADVERAKLVHFDEQDKPFVNWTRVWKLHNGAIWQLYEKMEKLEEENKALKENLSKMLTEG